MKPSVQEELTLYNFDVCYLFVVPVILLAVTTFIVSLRVYVRARLTKSWGLDDWLFLLAYVFFVAACSVCIFTDSIIAQRGLFLEEIFQGIMAGNQLYILGQIILKCALASFVMRVVDRTWQIWTIRISTAIYTAFFTAFFFVACFQCGLPTSKNLVRGHCLSWDHVMAPLNYLATSLNAMMDWTLTIVPIFTVYGLHISLRERLSVCVILLLGTLGSLVSLIRIPYIHSYSVFGNPNPSVTHDLIPIICASLAEFGIGIMALSLVALRPLFVTALQKTMKISKRRSSRSTTEEGTDHPFMPMATSKGYWEPPKIFEKPPPVPSKSDISRPQPYVPPPAPTKWAPPLPPQLPYMPKRYTQGGSLGPKNIQTHLMPSPSFVVPTPPGAGHRI